MQPVDGWACLELVAGNVELLKLDEFANCGREADEAIIEGIELLETLELSDTIWQPAIPCQWTRNSH